MRITEDARRSVVFLGHADDGKDASTFRASATGFFVTYRGVKYMVTAAHVAIGLGDDPFDMRMNLKGGGGDVIHFDPGTDPMDKWFLHSDPSVDLAVIAFPYDLAPWDHRSMSEALLLSEEDVDRHDIGPGDTCYAVGLFRLLQGKQRNVPVVHRGSLAAMPSDEAIPVSNWREGGTTQTRAYLVEATNLKGLSGSPVFVRPSINVVADRFTVDTEKKVSVGGRAALTAPSCDIGLLGIWSASWEASPDQVLALDQGNETRVPVGLGIVVPASRLIELLNSPAVEEQRAALFEKYAKSAKADAVA